MSGTGDDEAAGTASSEAGDRSSASSAVSELAVSTEGEAGSAGYVAPGCSADDGSAEREDGTPSA